MRLPVAFHIAITWVRIRDDLSHLTTRSIRHFWPESLPQSLQLSESVSQTKHHWGCEWHLLILFQSSKLLEISSFWICKHQFPLQMANSHNVKDEYLSMRELFIHNKIQILHRTFLFFIFYSIKYTISWTNYFYKLSGVIPFLSWKKIGCSL